MKIFYILSIIGLLVAFLLYQKSNKKLCLISSIIYSIGLLFCYNTFIVYLIYLLNINGSLLLYSIINCLVLTLLLGITFIKNKRIQEYEFNKKKLVSILCLGVLVFLIGSFRFRNFSSISFESGDAAVHYRHALEFSQELSILDDTNSQDIVYKAFERVMPISYVNCGFLMNIFSSVKSYNVFIYYNVIFWVLSALIFLITIIDMFKSKKISYISLLIISLIYILAFPFNNFIMGFCYLSLSVMVINLLLLTIFHFKDSFDSNIIFKITIIFLLTFACFYSYYQLVPAIYLALGLYYINLWKKKKINFKMLCGYFGITLIIPFLLGCYYFLITWFVDQGVDSVSNLIGLWGYCYDNNTPKYLFMVLYVYLVLDLFKQKSNNSDDVYLKLNVYISSLYVLIFLMLYIYKISDMYYFYKLFPLYWLIVILYFIPKIIKFKRLFYTLFTIMLVVNIWGYYNADSDIFKFIKKTNIYSWNTVTLIDDKIIYEKEELEILEESKKYENICKTNNRFLVSGKTEKTIWFYSITSMIPTFETVEGDYGGLYRYAILDVAYWEKYFLDYDCIVYYYEDKDVTINRNEYDFLYENDFGSILKRKYNK